ncbi:hypothetical protein FOA52_011573 [Chlamydomonas sp. UWO 241]|nr:hypothetical protein FOA52_011573 [Chlamydomonas sp. UWO 241]
MGAIALMLTIVAFSNLAWGPAGHGQHKHGTHGGAGKTGSSGMPHARRTLVDGGHRDKGSMRSAGSGHSSSVRAAAGGGTAVVKPTSATLLCVDANASCADAAKRGLCRSSAEFALGECARSCGMCAALARTVAKAAGLPCAIIGSDGGGAGADSDGSSDGDSGDTSDPSTDHSGGPGGDAVGSDALSDGSDPSTDNSGGSVGRHGCSDRLDICPYLARDLHLCESPGEHWWMENMCQRSCAFCGRRPRSQPPPFLLGLDEGGGLAMAEFVPAGAKPPPPCVDKEAGCADWARAGECDKNGAFMHDACAAACKLGPCNTPAAARGARLTLARPLPVLFLNNGVTIPAVGFGSAALGDGTQAAVEAAIKVGYRHVDGAMAREWYREDLVGAAVCASGMERGQLFLTTKVHPKDLGYDRTTAAFKRSLENLGTTYVDLLLLHYPRCWAGLPGCDDAAVSRDTAGVLWKESWRALEDLYVTGKGGDDAAVSRDTAGVLWNESWRALEDMYGTGKGGDDAAVSRDTAGMLLKESWRALEDLYDAGKVRAIGVSNFGLSEMQELVRTAHVRPQVLQTHVDPLAPAHELSAFCVQNGIQLEAYSSLGTQWPPLQPGNRNRVLTHPSVEKLSGETGRSPAQVVLRWVLQQGTVVLPRSANADHMAQSLALFDFGLSAEQEASLSGAR